MVRFSDRLGITTPLNQIQIDSINDELRHSLWNLLMTELEGFGQWYSVLKELFIGYYKLPIDNLPRSNEGSRAWLLENFMASEWFEAYNLIEYILQNIASLNHRKTSEGFERQLNSILERELSGHRAIKGQLVPISDPEEISAIEQAVSATGPFGFEGVRTHLSNALRLLGRKPEPDYPNSIKESISAVESICKVLAQEKSGGLDKALAKLSSAVSLHPALRNAFSSLYAYTSDEDGIRHAILESSDVGFAEAKYMLVSCSAFVNFVIEKARHAKLI